MSVVRFWELLEATTGLRWTEGLPRATIADHLQERVRDLGLASVDAYTAMLERESVRSAEWQLVLDIATNGQTWFFRGEPQLFEFERIVRRLAGAGRTPRIWSIACSTGEEVYTLAMLAAEAGVAASVLGTDLNAVSLGRAARGHYPASLLRHLPQERIDRFFTKVSDAAYVVKRSALGPVQFEKHNVVAEPPRKSESVGVQRQGRDSAAPRGESVESSSVARPETAEETSQRTVGWDVIFCRNVFIYFSDQTIAKVGRALASVLHDDGVLFLGAAETFRNHDVPLEPFFFEGGVGFRKKRATVARVRAAAPATPPPPSAPAAGTAPVVPPLTPARERPPEPTPKELPKSALATRPKAPAQAGQGRSPSELAQAEVVFQLEKGDVKAARRTAARESAGGGSQGALLLGHVELRSHDLPRALEAYIEAGRRHPGSKEAPYFQALVYHKQRRWNEALAAAQEAVRRNPDCWAAHYLTIGLYARIDKYEASAEARERTRATIGRGVSALGFETCTELLFLLMPTPAQVLETLDSTDTGGRF